MADLPPRITTLDGQTVQTPHVVMYKGSSPKQLANFNSTNGCYHVIDTVLAPKANVAPPPPPPQPSPPCPSSSKSSSSSSLFVVLVVLVLSVVLVVLVALLIRVIVVFLFLC